MNSLYSISYTIGNDPQQRILFAEMNDRQIREKRHASDIHDSLLFLFKQKVYEKINVCSSTSVYKSEFDNYVSRQQNWNSINICSVSKLT